MPSANLSPFRPPVALAPIRVAPGGRYFETMGGEPFLFIGFNDALDWPSLGGLFNRRDYDSADRYLTRVAESGVTVLRLMLEYTHHEHRYFEKPVGTFSRSMIRLWDDLFALCAARGLRVLLTPFDTFWMSLRWKRHPYNVANGGPAPSQQMLHLPAVQDAVIARLKFVIERWGGTGVIAAWDLWNEIHPHWGGTPDEQIAATRRIGDVVRAHEERCHGFTRPQTISIFGPDPQERSDLIFRHPGLDFATTHIYHRDAIDYPRDTVAPALAMGQWTRYGLRETPPNRPFTDSEHGPIHLFNDHRKTLPEAFDDEYERRMTWAHLCSGGAGSGMRWPARHPHVLTDGMLRELAALSRFTRECGIDFRTFAPRDLNEQVTLSVRNGDAGGDLHHFAVGDEQNALVYLLRTVPNGHEGVAPPRPALRDVEVTLAGRAPGQYRVSVWNVKDGKMQQTCTITAAEGANRLTLSLPPVDDEVALAVVRT